MRRRTSRTSSEGRVSRQARRAWTRRRGTTGATSIDNYGAAALGLLELSLARPERAIDHLAHCARLDLQHDIRLPSVAQSAADRSEAYVRTGALAEARAALATLEAQATAAGLRWPLGVAARCRGLLSRDDFEHHFADALEHFGTDMRFERALESGRQEDRVREHA